MIQPGTSSIGKSTFEEYAGDAWPSLYRSAYLLTGNHADAEDVAQQTLEKAYRSWSRVVASAVPEAYLRRMLTNTFLSVRCSKQHRLELSTDSWPGHEQPHSRPGTEDRLMLWPHLKSLPPGQRAVIVLRYFEDLSEEQIAETLGCSRGTVKSTAHRALNALRAALSFPTSAGGERTEMNENLEDALRRELREVADRLPVPPRPALRQAPARAARHWRPLLVAAAVTLIVGMVAALALYGAGRSMQPAFPPTPTGGTTSADATTPTDGWNLELSATPPRVLIANWPEDPDFNSYENNETWSGQLLYNDDCECFVLLEAGTDGAATMVAWLPGAVAFTEGGKHGIAQYHGTRVVEGAHLTGTGIRLAASEPAPIDLPASVRLRPGCLVVLGVD